jgi:hypothetical protein
LRCCYLSLGVAEVALANPRASSNVAVTAEAASILFGMFFLFRLFEHFQAFQGMAQRVSVCSKVDASG